MSERSKAALAAKAGGVKPGEFRGGVMPHPHIAAQARKAKADAFAARVSPIARELHAQGKCLDAIAAELTRRGIKTARGGKWAAQTVKNLLTRGGSPPDPAAAAQARKARADAFAARVGPIARELRSHGKSLEAIAAELARRDVRTARGGKWAAQIVKNLLARGAGH